MDKSYILTNQELNQLYTYIENLYNIAKVADYFCSNQQEFEELANLTPIIKTICQNADKLYSFFINFKNND